MVGAHHHQHLGVGLADLVADPEQLVGVAAGEAVLVGAAGALLGHHQPEPAAGPVEVPGTAVGDLSLQGRAVVLDREPHVGDPAVRQVGQREVDQLVDPGHGQRRLGPLPGQHVHPVAGTTGLDDGEHTGTGHGCMLADSGVSPAARPRAAPRERTGGRTRPPGNAPAVPGTLLRSARGAVPRRRPGRGSGEEQQPAQRHQPAGEAADQEVLGEPVDPLLLARGPCSSGKRSRPLAATTTDGRAVTWPASARADDQQPLHRPEQPPALEPGRPGRWACPRAPG